jgi:CRP/FNR family transcriptional regulator
MTWERQLAATALFGSVTEKALRALAEGAVHRKYRKGAVVFVQGEKGTRCYVIVSGTVKISAYHPDGREAVLAVLGPGDVFGELSLFDEAPRSADASVIEDAELLSIDKGTITDAATSHPELALALLQQLSRRLRLTNDSLQDVAFFDVAGRVARRLADLADAHGVPEQDGTLITLSVSQEALANMVGATRESVNKALAALTRRGLVARQGRRYWVANVEALRARAR